ncbi:DUF2835 family protein [Rhodoferax saidenbachensis]|uniref:DUF2835 domain-containing protein n=1 Tax=Rhodoferax saidenbachensis TaxID=1484693 RepID=A0ABU1ZSA4_9BURK|nr:DUF2835 family protein [Rhodoferax saidenbachensis]MDR7308363.1 hypothetical protein [Rhodoferax saidenbachensis]
MRRFEFGLSISAQDYLQYYRGEVRNVLARCQDGRTIQFPATLLTPFVTGRGIHGSFVLTCDDEGKGSRLLRQ